MSSLNKMIGAIAVAASTVGIAQADSSGFNIAEAEDLAWINTGFNLFFDDSDYGVESGVYYEEWKFTVPDLAFDPVISLSYDESTLNTMQTSNVEFYFSTNGLTWTQFFSPTTFDVDTNKTYYIGSYFVYTAGGFGDGVDIHGSLAPIPEPETYAMMGVGAIGLLWARRRKVLDRS